MTVPIILAVGAIVVVAVVMGIVLVRQKDPQRRATALKRTGAAIMALFTALGVMFVAGYALDDPGGTAGLLMTLTWVAPLLILAALAWFWPAAASPLLIALTAAFVAACVWFALDQAAARSLTEANGPVLAVAVLALAFPAAVLGLKKTPLAAWLLLALSVLPLGITLVARSGPVGSLTAAVVVPLITGVIYLLAARMERRGAAWAGGPRQARDVTEIGPGSNGR